MTTTTTWAAVPCPPPLTGGQKKFVGTGPEAKVSIDWLGLTFPGDFEIKPLTPKADEDGEAIWHDRFENVKAAIWAGTGFESTEWVVMETGMYGYRGSMVGPGGARLLFDAPGRDDYHLSMPGAACGMFSEKGMRSFITYAMGKKAKATRIDVNLDDYARTVSPLQVETALQGPDVVTHAHRGLTQRGFAMGTEEMTGVTVYIGQPSSRQRVRVYDKGLESNGEIDAVRWELQSRAEAAETLLPKLGTGELGREWGPLFSERLVSFVDFRDSSDHPYDLKQRDRLDWFAALVGVARKATSYLAKLPRTMNDVVTWVTKAVGPSLAMLFDFWKGDLDPLYTIIHGSELKPKHRAILARSG